MKRLLILLAIFLSAQSANSQSSICNLYDIETKIVFDYPKCDQSNGEIFVRRSEGGYEPYSYELAGKRSDLGVFDSLPGGTYYLITTDAKTCKDTLVIELFLKDLEKEIKPENVFTPNGDNINDTWKISGISNFKSADIKVFNRWGQQVFESQNYSNLVGWDGTNSGAELASGTYYYVISVNNNCIKGSIAGTVNIIK